MSLDAKTILALLGPLFLILGAARCLQAGGVPSQARTWLLIGTIFCAVAVWLWWGAPGSLAANRLGMTFVDCPSGRHTG